MSAAVLGIYGNSKAEAIYPVYFVDDAKRPLSGENGYELRFAPGQLPPVNAFWSLTLYELPSSLLSANRLNRYLINSPMLPSLKRDADGGVTLYVQHVSPGPDKEANWLPSPERTVLHGHATVLAEAGSARWTMDGASACRQRAASRRGPGAAPGRGEAAASGRASNDPEQRRS